MTANYLWVLEIQHLTNKKRWLTTKTVCFDRRSARETRDDFQATYARRYRVRKYEPQRRSS